MRFDDLEPDRGVTDALRRFDHAPPVSPSDVHRLVRSVVANAGPLLDQRRGRVVDWWEYPAVWARTLIPLGITAALAAAACILWATSARLPVASAGVSTVRIASGVETADLDSQRMLYALVAPVEQGVVPPPTRARR